MQHHGLGPILNDDLFETQSQITVNTYKSKDNKWEERRQRKIEEEAYEKLIMYTSPQDQMVQQGLHLYKNPISYSQYDFDALPVERKNKYRNLKNKEKIKDLLQDSLAVCAGQIAYNDMIRQLGNKTAESAQHAKAGKEKEKAKEDEKKEEEKARAKADTLRKQEQVLDDMLSQFTSKTCQTTESAKKKEELESKVDASADVQDPKLNPNALIMYGQRLIEKRIAAQAKNATASRQNRSMTELEQGKLLLKFLSQQSNPTKNRKFYEYFFEQQNKAEKIKAFEDVKEKVEGAKNKVCFWEGRGVRKPRAHFASKQKKDVQKRNRFNLSKNEKHAVVNTMKDEQENKEAKSKEMKITTGCDIDLTKIKKQVLRADGENYTGISFLRRRATDGRNDVDIGSIMDDKHGENRNYKIDDVDTQLEDIIWFIEDDQIAQDLQQAKEKLKTQKFSRTNVYHRLRHEMGKHMALNEVYDQVHEEGSALRKSSKAQTQLSKFRMANTNYMKKQELFIELMSMTAGEKKKTRNARAAAPNPHGRQAHMMVVPKSKTVAPKGAVDREHLTKEEVQILQKLVYGNRKKKSSFFHHLLKEAQQMEQQRKEEQLLKAGGTATGIRSGNPRKKQVQFKASTIMVDSLSLGDKTPGSHDSTELPDSAPTPTSPSPPPAHAYKRTVRDRKTFITEDITGWMPNSTEQIGISKTLQTQMELNRCICTGTGHQSTQLSPLVSRETSPLRSPQPNALAKKQLQAQESEGEIVNEPKSAQAAKRHMRYQMSFKIQGSAGGLQVIHQDSFNAADFPALRAANLESISDEGCLSEAPPSDDSDQMDMFKISPTKRKQPSPREGSILKKPQKTVTILIDEDDEEDSAGPRALFPYNMPARQSRDSSRSSYSSRRLARSKSKSFNVKQKGSLSIFEGNDPFSNDVNVSNAAYDPGAPITEQNEESEEQTDKGFPARWQQVKDDYERELATAVAKTIEEARSQHVDVPAAVGTAELMGRPPATVKTSLATTIREKFKKIYIEKKQLPPPIRECKKLDMINKQFAGNVDQNRHRFQQDQSKHKFKGALMRNIDAVKEKKKKVVPKAISRSINPASPMSSICRVALRSPVSVCGGNKSTNERYNQYNRQHTPERLTPESQRNCFSQPGLPLVGSLEPRERQGGSKNHIMIQEPITPTPVSPMSVSQRKSVSLSESSQSLNDSSDSSVIRRKEQKGTKRNMKLLGDSQKNLHEGGPHYSANPHSRCYTRFRDSKNADLDNVEVSAEFLNQGQQVSRKIEFYSVAPGRAGSRQDGGDKGSKEGSHETITNTVDTVMSSGAPVTTVNGRARKRGNGPTVFSDQDLEEKLISSPNGLFENVFMQDRIINSSCDGDFLSVPNYSTIHPAELSDGGRVDSKVMALMPQKKQFLNTSIDVSNRYHPHRKAKLKSIEQNRQTNDNLNFLIMSATQVVNRRGEDKSALTRMEKDNAEFQQQFQRRAHTSQYAAKQKLEAEEKEQRIHKKLLRQYRHLVDPKYAATPAQRQEGQRERDRKVRVEKAVYKTFDGLESAFTHFDQLKAQHDRTKQSINFYADQRAATQQQRNTKNNARLNILSKS